MMTMRREKKGQWYMILGWKRKQKQKQKQRRLIPIEWQEEGEKKRR